MPVTVIQTVLPIGGTGTYTITDTTAAAIELQTLALGSLFGPTAAATPGLTQIVSGQAESIKLINEKMSTLADKLEQLSTAVGGVNKSQADVLTALANMQFTLIETKTIQTMAFADQSYNNKFQQNATNQALADAGKPAIEVKPEEVAAATKRSIVTVGTINGQVAATNIVQEYVISAVTKGYAISQQWIAQTAFGKFVQDYYAVAKIQTQLLYADEKTARELKDQLNVIRARRTNPTAA
jgi:hypothetical protein